MNLEDKGGCYKRKLFLIAAEKGHLKILKLLKKHNVNVYATDEYGNNALHFAQRNSANKEVIDYLKSLGLN